MPLENHVNYVDGQVINIVGPNGTSIGYIYNDDDRAFYAREASVIASTLHGATHVGLDPVPTATIASSGLMSKDDKAKLDSITGTRIGILGFQGAGFPDDGGWLQGDIIFASGSEAISLERVGNIVRFVVDVPTPLSCPCEACAEIYWVRDFADSGQNGYAIRGPQCGGLLPDVHTYGEFKVYLTPSNTIYSNPDSELPSLLNNIPAFVFKRYDDGLSGGTNGNQAELEMVLDRMSNSYVTKTGWSMTPGASGVAECVWHMGIDDSSNKIEFKLLPEGEPDLLGALLYKGHTLTKRSARITGLDATNSSTNMYTAQWWDVDGATSPTSETITVTNAVNYDSDGIIIPDVIAGATLAVGRIVQVYSFLTVADTYRHYCHEIASLNPSSLWYINGAIEFGNVYQSRDEDDTVNGCHNVEDFRNWEHSIWGLAGVYDPLVVDGVTLNQQNNATIDTSIPGLVVSDSLLVGTSFANNVSTRPVTIWNRASVRNSYMEIYVARPEQANPLYLYPPIDILLRSPIDSYVNQYAYIKEVQVGAGTDLVAILSGVRFVDVPQSGYIRVISTDNGNFNCTLAYQSKSGFAAAVVADDDLWDVAINVADYTCVSGTSPGMAAGDIVEILHEDYTTPAIRLLFNYASGTGSVGSGSGSESLDLITMQAQVGTLSMCVAYPNDVSGTGTDYSDNYIRGFDPGYAVSAVYSQTGHRITDSAGSAVSVPSSFKVYDGSVVDNIEWFNVIKVLVLEDQVYLWWNDLPIPPSTTLSAALSTPVDISTSYFPISDEVLYGKYGVKLWPGATMRRILTKANLETFSPYSLGI